MDWKGKIMIVGLVWLSWTVPVRSEGTREYRPTASDFGSIRIGDALQVDLTVRFATFLADDTEKLRIRINDPSREVIYYGFNISFGSNVYVRIKDPDGNIVVPSTLIPASGTGFISTYSEAITGPAQINAGGYDAWTLNPSKSGDYIIEFNAGDPVNHTGNEFIIDLFDISVYDNVDNQVKTGRLWSQKWAGNTNSFTNEFHGQYYIYAPVDQTLSLFEPNGMRPYTFEIFANSTGPYNTGNIVADRKSADDKAGTPEYYLFLNPPDPDVFPVTDLPATFLSDPTIEKCGDDFCISIEVNRPGIAEVFIELNGIEGFQEGTEDVRLFQSVIEGVNLITWDGNNNFSADVSSQEDVIVNIKYGTVPTHIPIYDVEANPNGFKATTLAPVYQEEQLHFDDSDLGAESELDGCEGPCHSWVPETGCCNSIGNTRTVNTWWFNNKGATAVWINPTNQAPVAENDSILGVNLSELVDFDPLSNDSDADGNLDLSTLEIITDPVQGTAIADPVTGTIEYSSNNSYVGIDSLQYRICDDGEPVFCDEAWVYLEIGEENLPPVAIDDQYSMDDRQILTLNLLSNDSDPDGELDETSFQFIDQPLNGSLVSDEEGRFIYMPNAGFEGVEELRYGICDNGNSPLCDTATVFITVTLSELCQLHFPEGISPNGDGMNDQWNIAGIDCYPENKLKIFNRWGNEVFQSQNYNNIDKAWKGEVNTGLAIGDGRIAPNGTYFYILQINSTGEKHSGLITINR